MAQNYGVFSIDHSITSEYVQIIINLTEEKNGVIQKEVQQLAEETIKQHQFDLQLFHIEVQNKIVNFN